MRKVIWKNEDGSKETSYHWKKFGFFKEEKMVSYGYSMYTIDYLLWRLVVVLISIGIALWLLKIT